MGKKYKIGFIVNPIAGMGGRVGLKGTDGVVDEAIKKGAKPIARKKATDMLKTYVSKYNSKDNIVWYTCKNKMGEKELKEAGIKNFEIIYSSNKKKTSPEDTIKACEKFLEKNVDLILFCGGDGTARDIYNTVETKIPILGVPSGVKMHSGVFGINTDASARILHDFVNETLTVGEAEIMDLDEDLYRKGEWKVKLFGTASGIVEPTYVQVGKASFQSVSDDYVKDEIADHIKEEMEQNNDYLYLMGSGGTVNFIAKKIQVKNTILGIDAVYQKENIGEDLNEKEILKILKKYSKVKVILSPIGAQGFILGRGNLQLSPTVIKKIDLDDIIVVSTPSKLSSTPVLRVDTGDKKLDKKFIEKEYFMVVIGYRLSRVVKVQTNNF